MRKNKLIIGITVLCMLLSLSVLFGVSTAAYNSPWDVGNYNDYNSYDDGYDYDDDDDDYSYSHDYDDDDYDYDDDDDDDYDYYSGGHSGGSGGSGSGSISSGTWLAIADAMIKPIAVVIILAIFMAVLKSSRNKNRNRNGNQPQRAGSKKLRVAKPGNHQTEILAAINSIDPDFSDIKFIAWTKENFIILQNAWTARDWSRIRPFEKEELFRQHELQLEEYKNLHRINYIENINISDAYLHLYRRDNQYEYLTIYLSTRMIDYIVDENTGNVIKGRKDQYCYIDYLMTYMRKKGVKTTIKENNTANVCPHCGAPLEAISSAGQCDYCGCIVTSGDFDWVLAEMDALRPGLSINESGVIITETEEPNMNGGQNNQDNRNNQNGQNNNL